VIDQRRWYTEPETFVAVAALIVSITAVVVGIYEAALQRRHDRAEAWPHVEIATFTRPTGVAVELENGGVGPAVIKSAEVFVDGRLRKNWVDVATAIIGHAPGRYENTTVADHSLRAGERVTLLGLPSDEIPPHLWDAAKRVRVVICYASIYGDATIVSADHLGGPTHWTEVKQCSPQPNGVEF
jgi:hypothetical protein